MVDGFNFPYTITDVSDGSTDNTAVLEASGRDTIQLTSGTGVGSTQATYLGRTVNEGDIFTFSGGQISLLSNNNYANGTVVTLTTGSTALCFTTGTLIRTARGEVAVEDLIVGDLAVTASGTLRPITWIGNRDLDAGGEALPHNEQPIRIRAGAFGPGLPARDLRLSHGHPVLVGADANGEGGVLVPVMCLINGTSVLREPATRVTYWHVELEAHDILLAEGLAAESYYDMGSRVWFAGEDGLLTDPDFVPVGEHGRCRPVAVDGALVDGERKRLDAVFARTLNEDCGWSALPLSL
ncbi:hypothetical protein ASF53_14290 [Methylobacterium sp. Leaf123]|nr:hypothetical protein ASF53_14290 [Methylobacterium sp. Leaf123]